MEWWGWLAATLGGIVLIANALNAIKSFFAPLSGMKDRIEAVENFNASHQEEAEKRFIEVEDSQRAILKALFYLVNHEIDGNGIEGLKKVRDELSKDIIER